MITLDIDLSSYNESLTCFLNKITNLTHLVALKTIIPDYRSVDFREAKFPHRLCSFKLEFANMFDQEGNMDFLSDPIKAGFAYIVLDEVPESLNRFCLVDRSHCVTIVVDGSKGETIASMKRQINFEELYRMETYTSWIQYSCFHDEDLILDSLSTLFVV
ncbi:unnamed protein product [Ambrosiozyma monospora]|uniref:Unnamed protein product n=1 Tax=Ambrosiozyma monospora TaxID=43982 RepID=A0ACB5TL02_AMBMO|nr:unnamed protein product [Ambrosiozyma monospora]